MADDGRIHYASNQPNCASRWRGRVCALLGLFALCGCQRAVLSPAGPVMAAEKTLLIDSLAIMLAIVIPTIIATFAVAWWFRESNPAARRLPNFAYSGQIELIVWGIPFLVIGLLGGVTWVGAHMLDPAEPIASSEQKLRVQVVSLDWKWLFIYPDQHVASVNELVIPVGVPIEFSLTSASVMNAFFIPQLGSMIYTMNHMSSRLNLEASQPGLYRGISSHFSGDGFSGMHFTTRAVTASDFANWLNTTRESGPTLDEQSYEKLEVPSLAVKPFTYRDTAPGLYDRIVSLAVAPAPGPNLPRADIAESNPIMPKSLSR